MAPSKAVVKPARVAPKLSKAQAAVQFARLAEAVPHLRAAYVHALERWMGDPVLRLLGLPIVTECYRSNATQAAYYAQGRPKLYSLLTLNQLRKTAGLAPFKSLSGEAARIITYKRAGESNHNQLPSPAIDVAFLLADGSVSWSGLLLSKFAQLMKYADARVRWGGDWSKFKDLPHFEVLE